VQQLSVLFGLYNVIWVVWENHVALDKSLFHLHAVLVHGSLLLLSFKLTLFEQVKLFIGDLQADIFIAAEVVKWLAWAFWLGRISTAVNAAKIDCASRGFLDDDGPYPNEAHYYFAMLIG